MPLADQAQSLAALDLIRPLLVDANALAVTLSSSLRTIRRLDAAGRLPRPVRLGGRQVRWTLDGPNGIRRWIELGCPSRNQFEAIQKETSL